jgi:hypothetical protein
MCQGDGVVAESAQQGQEFTDKEHHTKVNSKNEFHTSAFPKAYQK